jgi:hypothetical protein
LRAGPLAGRPRRPRSRAIAGGPRGAPWRRLGHRRSGAGSAGQSWPGTSSPTITPPPRLQVR